MEHFAINHSQLEYTTCPLCGTDKPDERKQFSFQPFRVQQCTHCHLWYLSPRLTETEILKIYADPQYFTGGNHYGYAQPQGSYLAQERALRATFKRFIQQLKRRGMTGGHLLEIGCGYGFLLANAAPYFTSVTGTDFNQEALHRLQQSGYLTIHGGINDIPQENRYDLIIATGVIEHIYHPQPFVQKLAQHLTPYGWIILATPPMNSFWFKLQGKRWPSFKIPEHVTYYDCSTLTELYRRAGATRTIILPYPQAYPLGMISQKLGFTLPTWLAKYHLWLPQTMFAIAARFQTR
jgi:SAM-dependent methyltransferase